jgi:hypothetical protein
MYTKDEIINIARQLSHRMDQFFPAGEMARLHRELKVALSELDHQERFRCTFCKRGFKTFEELSDHTYSAEHLKKAVQPFPSPHCVG